MPKRILRGKVVSDKMQKTVVVSVDSVKKHPFYGKNIKSTKKYKARNEMDVKEGMTVKIEESKPYSKTVTWKVIEILDEEQK